MERKELENTEEKILDAAKEVFIIKGMDGARMQEIADKAGINKSLLHYYYRTKERLFIAVFKFAFKTFSPKVSDVFATNNDLFDQIRKFVYIYIDLISKHPFIPLFIINEINRKDISFISDVIGQVVANFDLFEKKIEESIKKGKIKKIGAEHLITNIIALCLFPFISMPLLQEIIFNNDKKAIQQFMNERKEEVSNFIINSIKI